MMFAPRAAPLQVNPYTHCPPKTFFCSCLKRRYQPKVRTCYTYFHFYIRCINRVVSAIVLLNLTHTLMLVSCSNCAMLMATMFITLNVVKFENQVCHFQCTLSYRFFPREDHVCTLFHLTCAAALRLPSIEHECI